MNIERLVDILSGCTVLLRKGEPVVEREAGALHVTEIYDMPHESEALPHVEKIDLELVVVGVDKETAEKHKAELIEILRTYPNPEELAGGPSYITVGGTLGSQSLAFMLFAMGKVLGLWGIITPRTLHIQDDEQVRYLCGVGMIMISGFQENQNSDSNGENKSS